MREIGNPLQEPPAFAGPNVSVAAAIDASWMAVYTSPRHEKKVAEHFTARQIEHFLPLYQSQRHWNNGCTVQIQVPLFPNYIFVRTCRQERVRVLEVPGVVSLVGAKNIPSVLPDFEIESLRDGLTLRKFEPHAYLVVGEKVRIKAGPLTGMSGVLVRKNDNLRVVLNLDAIMQSVAVEVDINDVEAWKNA